MADKPICLRLIEIEQISWELPARISYENEDSITYTSDDARAVISGFLPMSHKLLGLQNGCGIRVQFTDCGPPNVFREEDTIMRLQNCQLEKAEVNNVTAIIPDDSQHMPVCLVIHCRLDVVVPKMAKT